jgi:hypothetical protein
MIVLNELGRDACRFQIAAAPGFGKEASRVAMNLRNEEFNLRDIQGRYFHNAILARDGAVRKSGNLASAPHVSKDVTRGNNHPSPNVAIVLAGTCCAA